MARQPVSAGLRFDWLLAALAVAASVLHIPIDCWDHSLLSRPGNPEHARRRCWARCYWPVFEATRRAMGWPLPVIAIVFMAYALAGPQFPDLLNTPATPGRNWSTTSTHDRQRHLRRGGRRGEEIRLPLRCSFGVLATRIGLGPASFLNVASAVARHYAGGPAKDPGVFGSACSACFRPPVANAVTVGSLTIRR